MLFAHEASAVADSTHPSTAGEPQTRSMSTVCASPPEAVRNTAAGAETSGVSLAAASGAMAAFGCATGRLARAAAQNWVTSTAAGVSAAAASETAAAFVSAPAAASAIAAELTPIPVAEQAALHQQTLHPRRFATSACKSHHAMSHRSHAPGLRRRDTCCRMSCAS